MKKTRIAGASLLLVALCLSLSFAATKETGSAEHSKPMPISKDLKQSSEVKKDSAKTLSAQTICPVMGDKINKKLFVDYNDKRIYVCCKMCISEVKKDPEKYIKVLEDKGQSVETIAPKKSEKTNK